MPTTFVPVDLVDMAEIALRLNVEINTVRMWRKRGKLPPPYRLLKQGPVWLWSQINPTAPVLIDFGDSEPIGEWAKKEGKT